MKQLKKGDKVRYTGNSFPDYKGSTCRVDDAGWPSDGFVALATGEITILDSGTPDQRAGVKYFSPGSTTWS
ncbi:hypothetical protein [Schleiferilactobacillus perolens]|uniref:hypothetical protein n=1 Tax=Schleiferilactobacillus perolens TaxID=100468 RepID=UPI00070B7177|nr:hypothetical protein [Schleiferilactobacillus perolens]